MNLINKANITKIKYINQFINKRSYVSEFHINLIKNIINEKDINNNDSLIKLNNNSNNNSSNSNNNNNSNNGIDNININNINNKFKKEIPKKLRPHINPFSVRDIVEIPKWDEIYSNLQLPIHIDLGCGQGEMLFERSLQNNKNMLGIDMRDIYIEIAKRNQIIYNINNNINNNLHYLVANINLNIKNIGLSLPKQLIKEISIFFPDPWFKKRQNNRRLVNQQLVQDLYDISANDVTIYIQSDCRELALEIREHFINSNLYKEINLNESWDNIFPKTKYQKIFPQEPDRFIFNKINK